MNDRSPLLLIGIGTAGCAIARGINRAYGEGLRTLLLDTDAATGGAGDPFVLLGGDRLSGRGAGGDIVAARLAVEETIKLIDPHVEDVRVAVIVTCLGGGTGGAATLEAARELAAHGIAPVVFATTPFAFEGEDRLRNARGLLALIEESASATFVLALDRLVQGADQMNDALRRALDTVASGVTLFWRLLEKPGYLRLDAERLRHLLGAAGSGRFATVTVQGPDRAAAAVDRLRRTELLAGSSTPVRAILCGVLAGDDLRLSEIDTIARGVRAAFGERLPFDLGTVNDEATFSGRLSVVVLLFERSANEAAEPGGAAAGVMTLRKGGRSKNPLAVGPTGRGRFNNSEPTIWNGEDLDLPTFLRRNITLEF